MPQTVASKLDGLPRKNVAMRGEGLLKKVEAGDLGRAFGRVIGRAFEHAGLTQQEIAFRLGYSNQSAVSRWVAGTEAPQLAKLWALDEFKLGFLIALAEAAEDQRVRVLTTVTVERRRA